jgi:hypothetical protein
MEVDIKRMIKEVNRVRREVETREEADVVVYQRDFSELVASWMYLIESSLDPQGEYLIRLWEVTELIATSQRPKYWLYERDALVVAYGEIVRKSREAL